MPIALRFAPAIRSLAALAAAILLSWSPASAQWLRAESPSFVVYSQGEEETLRRRVGELEDFHQLLRQLTGTSDSPSGTRLPVYMVRGIGEMRRIWPQASTSVGGFYSASPAGILAVVDTGADRSFFGRNELLFHEYAHHFMLQHFPAVYPQWYIEGFAEYLMTARFEGQTVEFGRYNEARASWLANRLRWLPTDTLLFGDPGRLEGAQVAQFYAQSWLVVHYMLRDAERMGQLNRYLAAVSAGQEARAAFARIFGMNASQLHRRLNDYSTEQLSFTRVRRASAARPPAIAIARLPASAEDLLLMQASMRSGVRLNPDSFVRRVRRAAGNAADPFAMRVLAEAEAQYGDGAAAERLLTELLAASPRDAELLFLMGMRHLVAGRADEAGRAAHFRTAQTWFARAHRADETHYPTLYRYAEGLSADPALLSENTTNILLLAQQIAPQAHAIRLSAANLQIRRGRWADAEALLLPLASHAHAGAMTRLARTLLQKARARDSSGLPGVFEVPAEDED
jgi:hypothetical protein